MDNNNMNENNYGKETIDYDMGTVKAKPNMILGIIGALIGAIVGGVAWGLIAMTGTMLTAIAILIAFLTIFLYEKFAKGIDIKGIIICSIISLVTVYLAARISSVLIIIKEFNDTLGWDLTYSKAEKYLTSTTEMSSAYYHDLIISLVFAVVGVVAVAGSKLKELKNSRNQNNNGLNNGLSSELNDQLNNEFINQSNSESNNENREI